jgi:hypothetical protein
VKVNAILAVFHQQGFGGFGLRKNFHSPLGSGDQNVKTALTALPVQWTKSLRWCPAWRMRLIGACENHYVPLVTLNIFKIANK